MTDAQKAEYESVIQKLTTALEQALAENTRLRSSENSAHAVLREVYNDPTASPAIRVKAATAALPHETPRLEPVPPPLDLVAEEYEPLSVVVERQRKRADALLALPLEERSRLITGVGRDDGNGSDDTAS
jgi:hypothetical protein